MIFLGHSKGSKLFLLTTFGLDKLALKWYKWNETSGQCDKCPPGYTGVDCAYRCHYPTYGEDCFMTCECFPETCDFVSGCEVTSTTVTSSEHHTTNSKDVVFPCEFYRNYCGRLTQHFITLGMEKPPRHNKYKGTDHGDSHASDKGDLQTYSASSCTE